MDNTALIIIDVQSGIFTIPNSPVYKGDELLENISYLINKARQKRLPIIYVQHQHNKGGILEYGSDAWEIHHQIKPAKDDIIIHKTTPDSFHETTLKDELDKREINKLILVGFQTEYCVDTTCRRAFSLGYDVILVKDGHSTLDSLLKASEIIEHHNGVLGNWFAELKSTKEVI